MVTRAVCDGSRVARIVALCLEGEGFTSVGGETAPIRAGQQAHWPPTVPHRLWTGESPMLALMIERPPE